MSAREFELWRSAWLSAYSRPNPRLIETPVPDWALRSIYEVDLVRAAIMTEEDTE